MVKGGSRGKEASAPPHPDSKDGEGEGGADLATATLQLVSILIKEVRFKIFSLQSADSEVQFIFLIGLWTNAFALYRDYRLISNTFIW